MKFGQIVVYLITCFWFSVGDWKLVPGPFMILVKLQYNEICPVLLVDIYHFNSPLITLETWHWLLSNWSRLLNSKGPGT